MKEIIPRLNLLQNVDSMGERYRRILATYQLDDGRTSVRYIYSSREDE